MAIRRRHPLFTPLTFEPFEIDDEELGADTPQRAAKRRRIEANANRYLQGSTLFIQTASLRGPFTNGWQNPWAKKKPIDSKATARHHRQTTREPSLAPESTDHQFARPPRFKHTAINANPRLKERQARAEAEHVEQERRKAKAERREQRRQELRKREEKAAELLKDGRGKNTAQPVDLVGESFNTRLTAEALGDDRPVAVNAEQEDITRSMGYGSREIRSSFTDDWLTRLRSPAKTPELSPVHIAAFEKQMDTLEAMTPTKRPSQRSHIDDNGNAASRFNVKPRSERQRSLVPESRHPSGSNRRKGSHHGEASISEKAPGVRKTSTAPSSSFPRPQDLPLKPQISGSQERTRHARERSNAPNPARAKTGMPPPLQVDLNEELLLKKPSSGNHERVDYIPANIPGTAAQRGIGLVSAPAPEEVSSRPAPRHRKHTSGFTPINQRFSSPPAEPSEPAVSTTPPGRPVLGVKTATNNANPAGLTRPPFRPRNEDIQVLSAGEIRLDNGPHYPLSGALEEQENKARNDENKISGQLPLKEALVQSAKKCVTRKRRRDHPLNASPTATNSPGFSYRRASNPTVNAPKLQPTDQVNKEAGTRKKKKRARLMTFGSLPSLPVEEVPQEEHQSTTAGVPGGGRSEAVVGSQAAKDKYCSPVRDLSTQAAFAFAQKEFQREFRSPLRNAITASPEKVAGSQQTRASTPPPSQPPAEYTAITPFKVFNKGRPFLAENQSQLEPAPVSTQELFNTATPLAFSTVKKDKSARKRVSMAVSPLKSANNRGASINAGKDEGTTQKDGEGETTVAEVTFADLSTTPPTPNFTLLSQRAPPSALKPPSLIPSLSSALKPRNPCFTSASRTTSQANSSFSRLAPPPSSAPVLSHPVRQEYRRVLSQGHGHSRSPSQSSQQQQRSSQQLAQRQPALLDDVDLDSAMDAADSFLDTVNLDVDFKGPTVGSGARKAR